MNRVNRRGLPRGTPGTITISGAGGMHMEMTRMALTVWDANSFPHAQQVHEKHRTTLSTSCMHASSTTRWHLLHVYLMPQMFARGEETHCTKSRQFMDGKLPESEKANNCLSTNKGLHRSQHIGRP